MILTTTTLVLVSLLGFTAMGAGILRLFLPSETIKNNLPLAYWAGFAWVGWATFWAAFTHTLAPSTLGSLFIPALFGIPTLLEIKLKRPNVSFATGMWISLFAIAALLNLAGAAMPPTEGDSLAYHFALPKWYTLAGGLVYQPTAVTFAVPQFTHMVSTAAYTLGGEHLMVATAYGGTLMAALMAVAVALLYLSPSYAWALGALVLTTPVVTYAFSAGSVELRLMGLVMAATWALHKALQIEKPTRLFLLTGVFLGGALASKLFSLFLLPAFALPTIWRYRHAPLSLLTNGLTLAATTAWVGLPWYLLLWVKYGSPLFPEFATLLHSPYWSEAQQTAMEILFLQFERMVPRDILHFATYPFTGSFEGKILDSDRTGLGPFVAPAIYFLIAAATYGFTQLRWKNKAEPSPFPWLPTVLFLTFYICFFFLGVSGRLRHLLPVWPLALIPLFFTIQTIPAKQKPLLTNLTHLILAGTFIIQLSMAFLLNTPALKVLAGKLSGETYLSTYASAYAGVALANGLPPGSYVLTTEARTLNYYLNVPYYQAYAETQQEIPLATGTPASLLAAIQKHHFTHWLTIENPNNPAKDTPINGHKLFRPLIEAGCFAHLNKAEDIFHPSRAAQTFQPVPRTFHLFKLMRCTYNNAE